MATWQIACADGERRASQINWLVLDVDGVLTDGRLYTFGNCQEIQAFHVHDGLGIRLWQRAGKGVAVITGRSSAAARARCAELGITHVYQNAHAKDATFAEFARNVQTVPEQVCYCGDELVDVPLLQLVGLAATVPDAVPEARAAAHLVLTRPGGRGAVRELTDLLLKLQGHWDRVTACYYAHAATGSI
jgi:3-deoxy-D-manno-octulosonate 8-phosphate phosphatase (KDO 8-P phosphatase)